MDSHNHSLTGYSLAGYSPSISGYGPADFADAEETTPTEILLDPTRTGGSTPYQTTLNNVLARTLQEHRETYPAPQPNPGSWKKKMREFLMTKNEDLVGFLSKKLPDTSTVSKVEAFMRKYGRSDFPGNNPQYRERFLDLSGEDAESYMVSLNQKLAEQGKSNYIELMNQVRYLFEQYRDVGNRILTLDGQLRAKLEILDKLTTKVMGFGNLPQNSAFEPMLEASKAYISEVFEANKVEETYTELVRLHKKFYYLRDALQFLWTFEGAQREPLCSICFNEAIQFAIVPCGHTFCGTCVKRQMMNCCICRGSVREKLKLFLT